MKKIAGMQVNGNNPPVRMALEVSGLSSAAWYDRRPRKNGTRHKPGPLPTFSDRQVLKGVRALLHEPVFYGEGYKKLCKRLRTEKGIIVGKERLRRIMSAHDLLCGQRNEPNGSSRTHDGTILTQTPNKLWGYDIKEWRTANGKIWMFSIMDHFNSEVISWGTTIHATQDVAMDVLRAAVRKRFSAITKGVCEGIELYLRTDYGSQFTAHRFNKEVSFLGLKWSRAFVRSPECNGVIERYHGTIKDQIGFKIEVCDHNQAKILIGDFVHKYNTRWYLHRLGLITPEQCRINYYVNKQIGKMEPVI